MIRPPASLYRYTPGSRGSWATFSRSSIEGRTQNGEGYNLIMSRWLPLLLVAGLATLACAQDNQPGQLKKERPKQEQKTSDKEEIPPEEDTSLATENYSFNPLQSKKDITVGDEYAKKHNFRAAAGRHRSATKS